MLRVTTVHDYVNFVTSYQLKVLKKQLVAATMLLGTCYCTQQYTFVSTRTDWLCANLANLPAQGAAELWTPV